MILIYRSKVIDWRSSLEMSADERKAVDACSEEGKPNPSDPTIEATENNVTSPMRDIEVIAKLKTGKKDKGLMDKYFQILRTKLLQNLIYRRN